MSTTDLSIDGEHLTIGDLVSVARGGRPVQLASEARKNMGRSYAWVREAGKAERPVYGVTTGFGSLARVTIAAGDRAKLSLNLVRSHAAGVGAPLSVPVVRGMMLLRANALAKGASGCRPLLVDTILAMLNAGVTPLVPSQGSCGSSGDLAPLAHLGLVMADGPHGEAHYQGQLMFAGDAMAAAGIPRLVLEAKDGLAITNGAQLTTSIAALACHDACNLILAAEVAAAMSIEALRGATRAFHPAVHRLRPYVGSRATAANLCRLMAGSSLVDSVPHKVQDAYSLRCTPQVVGAARDAIAHAVGQVQVELNAATDNPVILVDADPAEGGFESDPKNFAYSAGLFHGEHVGISMDLLKIAVAEAGSLSERRLYRLTTGSLSQRLPAGLARADRPELGFMLPQTTAAALVSENKSLGWPASMDSIPTCEDQEDHVAMSTTAARRAAEVVENAQHIIAIELLGAAHALAFRSDEQPNLVTGQGTGPAFLNVVRALGQLGSARSPSEDIGRVVELVKGERMGLLDGLPALIPVGSVPPEGKPLS